MKLCKLIKSAEWTCRFIFEGIPKNDTEVRFWFNFLSPDEVGGI